VKEDTKGGAPPENESAAPRWAKSTNTLQCSVRSPEEAALAYAEMGLRVLPIHTPGRRRRCSCGDTACPSTGKHPRTLHGHFDATTDKELISSWWAQWPDANVAIATGADLVVVDLDEHKFGYSSWEGLALDLALDRFLPTWTARTGRGSHQYFRPSRPIASRANVLPGLDVRGVGGFVVVPPSVHANGSGYAWLRNRAPWEVPLLDMPEPLELFLYKGTEQALSRAYRRRHWNGNLPPSVVRLLAVDPRVRARFERDPQGLADRSQSGVDASLACLLLHRGVDPAEVEHALRASQESAGLTLKRDSYYERTVGTALARVRDAQPR
jgi:hypothetical protein